MNIQTLATQCQEYLTCKTRDNGETFVTQTDISPEWFSDLVFECHGDLLPNDWSYFAIESAIDDLAGGLDYPEPNTSECRKWFYDFPESEYYCEEVFSGGHCKTIGDILNGAMQEHFSEVFYMVQNTLESQLDEMESE